MAWQRCEGRRAAPWLLLLAAGALAGCDGDDGAGARACDIRDRACQEQIFQLTAEVRGQTAPELPEIRTITEGEALAELRRLVEEEGDEDSDVYGTALELLGLLSPGQTLDEVLVETMVSESAAYYDQRTRRISVIDRGEPRELLESDFLLAHELVHALQDQAGQLSDFYDAHVDSTDSSVAITTLVEGEATLLGAAVLERLLGPLERLSWTSFVEGVHDGVFEQIETSDEPFLTAVGQLPYALGTLTLYEPWQQEGVRAFELEYEDPRLSVREWRGGRELQPERLDCLPTAAPPGYEPFDHDRLGETAPFAIAVALGHSASSAWGVGGGWHDDHSVVFRASDGSGGVAVAWRLLPDTETRPEDLQDLLSELRPRLRSQVIGRELLVYGATDDAVLDTWSEVAFCGTGDDLPAREGAPMETMTAAMR